MILNKKELATSQLRKDALAVIEAGYKAIDIETLTRKRLNISGSKLCISDSVCKENIDLTGVKRLWVIGFGKGSYSAVSTTADILGKKMTGAIALDTKTSCKPTRPNKRVKVFWGTHPTPSRANVLATQHIVRTVETLGEDDLILYFVGGGGSSLLCGSFDELTYASGVFSKLTQKGASINEINTVRKHLSTVKGGGLAYFTYPARFASLIVSDVCGNDFGTIASGPTVPDRTTIVNAKKVLKKYKISFSGFTFIQTPQDKKYFKRGMSFLLACNQDALMAMIKQARKRGYKASLVSLAYEGEAQKMFLPLFSKMSSKRAFVLGGETTVTLGKKSGKGGRNQEAVLGAVVGAFLGKVDLAHTLVASFASDGFDNVSVGGALADGATMRIVLEKDVDPGKFLAGHDSFSFFKKVGGHVIVERRSFNVSDLSFIISL